MSSKKKVKKIYLLTQNVVDGWDTYDSCVVVAYSEKQAKEIHPSEFAKTYHDGKWWGIYSGGERIGSEYEFDSDSWARKVEDVKAQFIGIADESVSIGVLCASFNAG